MIDRQTIDKMTTKSGGNSLVNVLPRMRSGMAWWLDKLSKCTAIKA